MLDQKERENEDIFLDKAIADAEKLLAQFEEGASLMDQGVDIFELGGHTIPTSGLKIAMPLTGQFAITIGKGLIERGAWQRGIKALRQARTFFSMIGDWHGQARAAVEIGDAHLLMGDYEVAQMSYLDAQRYLRKIGDEAGLAVTRQKLGTLALFMYQADEAEKQLKGALAYFESHGDRKRAEISRQLLRLTPDVRQGIPA